MTQLCDLTITVVSSTKKEAKGSSTELLSKQDVVQRLLNEAAQFFVDNIPDDHVSTVVFANNEIAKNIN